MAEQTVDRPADESSDERTPEVIVEIQPDNEKPGKPQLSDEEVEKLVEPPNDDEIGRYAKDAQRRIKNLHVANQEWRRRAAQSSRDAATATSLAEQLYRENQELKVSAVRSEDALILQAVERAEAQLEQAKAKARAAYAANDTEAVIEANEEVARFVAERDRLKLLKPSAPAATGEEARPADGKYASEIAARAGVTVPQRPVSDGVKNWLGKNQWFGKPGEAKMTAYAMGIHQDLAEQGITEENNPEKYWSTIDHELREKFPHRFQAADPAPPPAERATVTRPVAVAGATRTNGGDKGSPRRVQLTETQVRIARSLGITPEQYAAELVKENKAKGGGTIIQ